MSLTRCETVKSFADHTTNGTMRDIARFIPPRHLGAARASVKARNDRAAHHANTTHRTVPNDPGFILLLRTNNPRRQNVFGLTFTKEPDLRLRMMQRDNPTDTLVEVARIEVDRVRTAREFVLAQIKAEDGVRLLHDTWFTVPGGAETVENYVRRKARQINRRPERPVVRSIRERDAAAPKIVVVRKVQPEPEAERPVARKLVVFRKRQPA